ncbi:meiotic nuclear division protein 1 [Syncephalis plumigaleata]|nr:meiotic nuclear division protein 1 [Syncephalis plumigaleata]
MSKKRGVSAEEKRQRMQDYFHETSDVFQLKELEKILPKVKGIVAQSVKDVLQELVNDGLVHCEKIGTSNYYWSFPSESYRVREQKLASLQEEEAQLTEKKAVLEAAIEEANQRRVASDHREQLLAALAEAEARNKEYTDELQQFKDNDPDTIEAKRKAAEISKQAANRWTDNIFALQAYCSRKFNIEQRELRKHFNIPEDFDNVE